MYEPTSTILTQGDTMRPKTFILSAVTVLMVAIGFSQATGSSNRVATVEPLTDTKIAMIAVVAGNIDIRYAHLAMALSSDPTVRGFAGTMLADHAAINQAAGEVARKHGIEPEESEISRKLLEDSREIMGELTALRGAEFDRRYAANELAYHEFVNSALREQFIPAVQNEGFGDALEKALAVFEGHERLARSMVESVDR